MSNDVSNISPEENEERRLALLGLNAELAEDGPTGKDPFEQEAAEGLTGIKPEHVASMVQSLNTGLSKQLSKKKRKAKAIPDQSGIYIIIITLLVLIVVAYIVIKRMHGHP